MGIFLLLLQNVVCSSFCFASFPSALTVPCGQAIAWEQGCPFRSRPPRGDGQHGWRLEAGQRVWMRHHLKPALWFMFSAG